MKEVWERKSSHITGLLRSGRIQGKSAGTFLMYAALPAQALMIMEGRENLQAERQKWENLDFYSPNSQTDPEPVISSHWLWTSAITWVPKGCKLF